MTRPAAVAALQPISRAIANAFRASWGMPALTFVKGQAQIDAAAHAARHAMVELNDCAEADALLYEPDDGEALRFRLECERDAALGEDHWG